MTGYRFGDVVLVPFTDQTETKKRPAAVVSSAAPPIPGLLHQLPRPLQMAAGFVELPRDPRFTLRYIGRYTKRAVLAE